MYCQACVMKFVCFFVCLAATITLPSRNHHAAFTLGSRCLPICCCFWLLCGKAEARLRLPKLFLINGFGGKIRTQLHPTINKIPIPRNETKYQNLKSFLPFICIYKCLSLYLRCKKCGGYARFCKLCVCKTKGCQSLWL